MAEQASIVVLLIGLAMWLSLNALIVLMRDAVERCDPGHEALEKGWNGRAYWNWGVPPEPKVMEPYRELFPKSPLLFVWPILFWGGPFLMLTGFFAVQMMSAFHP